MKKKDWYKAMQEAAFPHMDFVVSARETATRDKNVGWAIRIVEVDLNIKLPNGYFSREKVQVDMDLLEHQEEPDLFLCGEVLVHIKQAYKAAGLDYTAKAPTN